MKIRTVSWLYVLVWPAEMYSLTDLKKRRFYLFAAIIPKNNFSENQFMAKLISMWLWMVAWRLRHSIACPGAVSQGVVSSLCGLSSRLWSTTISCMHQLCKFSHFSCMLGANYFPVISDLVTKWDRLVPIVTNPGLFPIRFQYILAREPKCTDIWSEKVPDLSHLSNPMWAHIWHTCFHLA